MKRFCTNCGSEMLEGARFCDKCGADALIKKSPTQAAPTARATRQRPSPAPMKDKKSGKLLCVILAIVLLLQTLTVALYGWPGFALGGGVGKTNSYKLKEGQTLVETKSGAAIDFGPYNEMDGETVVVKELTPDKSSVEGAVRNSYDITAGSRSEFDGLLTVTLPYDESTTDPNDEAGSVFAEYYNEESGEWELVDFDVNTEENTVTIRTDHLSSYCTLSFENAGLPYAELSRVSGRTFDEEKALTILREFGDLGTAGEEGSNFLSDFYSMIIPFGQLSNEGAEFINDVLGWLSDASDIAITGTGYSKITEVQSSGSDILLGLAAISLLKSMYDAYQGEVSAESVAATAYKLAYNAALQVKNLANSAMKLSLLGVIAIDFSLNSFMGEADQTYKDSVYKAVIAYNEELYPRSDVEWYKIMLGLYGRRGDNPDKFNEAMKGIMRNFSARYFMDDPMEQFAATNEAGLKGFTTGALPATEDAKEYCLNQYDARLGERLQPVLADVFKKIQYDAKVDLLKSTSKMRAALNSPLLFDIIEEIPEGEKSSYAGCKVLLTRPGGSFDERWALTLDKDGRASMEATILGYMQAVVPTELRLWEKGADPQKDEPILTQNFSVREKLTTILLGGRVEKYLLYKDSYETATVYGGRTIEEFFEAHPSMKEGRDMEQIKKDSGYIIGIEGKNGEALLKVYEAAEAYKESPLYTYGVNGISGTLDTAANSFTAAYGDGETIVISFSENKAYMDGPYAMRLFDDYSREANGMQNGMRYGLQPYK